ncbi:hypothetical protein TA3x_005313 [Tundrisphaera sp. TA3]|uniref:hypothetical protein n=1 Tax=Tundrisphaera sp. TA3 TaxID=3435775 RepID=UPI003EB983F0
MTLFVATDADLDSCFPSWRKPLAEQAPVEAINPFTKESMTFLSWDPGRPVDASAIPSFDDARGRSPRPPISPPENDTDKWLQKHEAPKLLRTLPYFTLYSIAGPPLRELLDLLKLPDSPPERIVDCPEEEAEMFSFPDAVIGPLGALDDGELKTILTAWQKALKLRGKALNSIETEAVEGSDWALRRIRALATEAARQGGHFFGFVRYDV